MLSDILWTLNPTYIDHTLIMLKFHDFPVSFLLGVGECQYKNLSSVALFMVDVPPSCGLCFHFLRISAITIKIHTLKHNILIWHISRTRAEQTQGPEITLACICIVQSGTKRVRSWLKISSKAWHLAGALILKWGMLDVLCLQYGKRRVLLTRPSPLILCHSLGALGFSCCLQFISNCTSKDTRSWHIRGRLHVRVCSQ